MNPFGFTPPQVSSTRMTPVAMEVLMYIFYCPDPIQSDSGAVFDAVARFIQMGVIKPRESAPAGSYECTALGQAWVEAILRTPCPEVKEAPAKIEVPPPLVGIDWGGERSRSSFVLHLTPEQADLINEQVVTAAGNKLRAAVADAEDKLRRKYPSAVIVREIQRKTGSMADFMMASPACRHKPPETGNPRPCPLPPLDEIEAAKIKVQPSGGADLEKLAECVIERLMQRLCRPQD